MKIKAVILYIKVAAFIIIPLILLFLPSTFFDEGSPKCLSILLLNQECYGCGITRACMHFLHFEFSDAISYHPLVVVIFPLLAFLWAKWLYTDIKKIRNLAS